VILGEGNMKKTKRCAKCGEIKPLSEFSKKSLSRDGLQYTCKVCASDYGRKYREANREKLAEYQREYSNANPEKVAEGKRKWRKANPEYDREYHKANREKKAKYDLEYRKVNCEKIAEYKCERYKANPGYHREYYKAHRDERAEYERSRMAEDIQYRLAGNLRKRLYNAVKGNFRAGSAVSDLGCSIEELKVYFETLFEEGMSWET